MTQDSSIPMIGEVVSGKYRIERVLGAGGMGVVFAAHHLGLDERVALKFLSSGESDPKTVERFVREGRAAVKIRSEHVARMIDVAITARGKPYLVMEYLDGVDVAAFLRERGRLDVPTAVMIVLQACEALAEAHALGIVHRDLKPANMFLTRRADQTPCLKLLDFGISKMMFEDTMGTTSASVLGTPHYMSPEQLTSSRDVDGRADVWALGVILHELLTGQLPFRAPTIPQVFVNVLERSPVALHADWPEAPRSLEAIVERALAKDRDERYPTVAALTTALFEAGFTEARDVSVRIARALNVPWRPSRQPPPLDQAAALVDTVEIVPTAPATPTGWEDGQTTSRDSPGRSRRLVPLGAGIAVIATLTVSLAFTRRTTSPVLPAPREETTAPASLSTSTRLAAPPAVASDEVSSVSSSVSSSASASALRSATTTRPTGRQLPSALPHAKVRHHAPVDSVTPPRVGASSSAPRSFDEERR